MNMGDILSKKIDRNGIYNNIVNHKIKKSKLEFLRFFWK